MDIKVSDEGYLYIEDRDLVMVTGEDAAKQDLRSRIRFIKGEYFLDSTIGIDYMNVVHTKTATDLQIEREFIKAIQESPFVDRITKFNITSTDGIRSSEIECSVLVVEGYEVSITERI